MLETLITGARYETGYLLRQRHGITLIRISLYTPVQESKGQGGEVQQYYR